MIKLPGTLRHQNLLGAIRDCYKNDSRILSIIVFGSLSEGTWDEHSDIDLDIIVLDGCVINVADELVRLEACFSGLGEAVAVRVFHGNDEADLVFKSLMQLSVRYHYLEDTHPNIVSNMLLLSGRLSEELIVAAGKQNQQKLDRTLDDMLNESIRHSLGVSVALKRNNMWLAEELLYRVRTNLLQLFTQSRGGQRAYYYFEDNAPETLQAKLRETFAEGTEQTVKFALLRIIDLLENDLPELCNEALTLQAAQQIVLSAIRNDL